MLKTGLTHETKVKVEENMTAGALRSGLVPVLATPVLLAIIENTCYECVMDYLEPGQTTVGTGVNITHEAPTPVGMTVTASCRLKEVEGRRLVFQIEVKDEHEVVSRGDHERFIVERGGACYTNSWFPLPAAVAKQADARDLKSLGLLTVPVRSRSAAPKRALALFAPGSFFAVSSFLLLQCIYG